MRYTRQVDFVVNKKESQEEAERLEEIINLEEFKKFQYLYSKLNFNSCNIRNIRKFCVSNYIVFYNVNESKNLVLIYRIIYSGRNYQKLL